MDNNQDKKLVKTFKGVVVSDKSAKTIIVSVERKFKHKLYHKQMITHKKYHVHDENSEAKMGDIVRFKNCRPRSALKRFELVSIAKKG